VSDFLFVLFLVFLAVVAVAAVAVAGLVIFGFVKGEGRWPGFSAKLFTRAPGSTAPASSSAPGRRPAQPPGRKPKPSVNPPGSGKLPAAVTPPVRWTAVRGWPWIAGAGVVVGVAGTAAATAIAGGCGASDRGGEGTARQFSAAEQSYLRSVKTWAGGASEWPSDEVLVDQGHTMCSHLKAHPDLMTEAATMSAGLEVRTALANHQVRTAIVELCPDQRHRIG